ncbi:MAG: LamG-like jellyroll fold domain-containing protein [Bacteroidota bacterium]
MKSKIKNTKKTESINLKTEIQIPDNQLKEEFTRWFLSIFSSLIIYFIIAKLIIKVYHPDINSLIELANSYTFLGSVRPEPLESMLFRAGIVTISLGLWGFYILYSKLNFVKHIAKNIAFNFISILLIIGLFALIYIDFSSPNPFADGGGEQPQNSRDYEGKTNFDFFFKGLFLYNNLLLYCLILQPLIAYVFFIGFRKKDWLTKINLKKYLPIFNYAFAGAIILSIILMSTFYFPYTFENKYNFNAVYYSMTQVYSGAPMLVDGFINTYGLYPQLLNPIFQIIGLNVFKFSLVMALISGLCFVFNFVYLKRHIKNPLILLLGFTTIVLFPFYIFKFTTPFDTAFGFHAVRYIIPSTLAILASFYFTKRSKIIYWFTYITSGFFILWNPEVGMICYIAWVVTIIYSDFYNSENKLNIKKILLHLLNSVINLIVVFNLFKFILLFFYGKTPEFSLLFEHIILFGKTGFSLLPMSLIHPWNISALILILGVFYSIIKLYKKEVDIKATIILLTSIISLGFLVYFQGRSHNWPFAVTTGFSIMLLTLLGDELWDKIKSKSTPILDALFYVFLFLVSFSIFEIFYGTKKIDELVYQKNDKIKQKEEENYIKNNESFIINNTKEKEKIHLFTATQYQSLYFNGNKRIAAFNPGEIDMLMHSHLKVMEKTIIDSSFSVFLEPKLCKSPYLQRSLAAVAASYSIEKSNQSMLLLKKRKLKTPITAFFNDSNESILYKKYNDDTTGIIERVNDSQGIADVKLPSEFSVNLLFYSQNQIYEYPTLIGNMDGTSGFMIAKRPNTNNCFFGINGKGYDIPMLNDKWLYCVVNYYPNRIEIFQNGNLINTLPLTESLKNSTNKLYIGNLGYLNFYLGSISEVAISKPKTLQEVQETWLKIEKEKL